MITVELTLTTRDRHQWRIIRETVEQMAPTARVIVSAGSDDRGRHEFRLHIARGTTDPRSWRGALVALAVLADEAGA
ncbi:MAG TPA: hypothetical protein PKD53_16705 [Chloroflexaceae bacterium]|nr:hypothetical protein [Chloroflexaceae bacterium]